MLKTKRNAGKKTREFCLDQGVVTLKIHWFFFCRLDGDHHVSVRLLPVYAHHRLRPSELGVRRGTGLRGRYRRTRMLFRYVSLILWCVGCDWWFHSQVVDPRFPMRGAPNPAGGGRRCGGWSANLLFGIICPENYMKIRQIRHCGRCVKVLVMWQRIGPSGLFTPAVYSKLAVAIRGLHYFGYTHT